jgi:FAD binding domain
MRATVTDDEVRQVVRDRYGEEAVIEEIRWASRFSDDSRLASRYRVGRVFLAGDAAHIHFAAGGQGLNLGVQDAMNLGWKLAAQLRGRAPAGLLDTYESERRPVAARVLDNVAAQSALVPATAEQRAIRALLTQLAALPEVQRHLSGLVSGLDVRYSAPEDAHPATGTRLPDFELENGHVSDLFHSRRFVLLTTRPTPAPHPEVAVAVVPRLPWPGVTQALIRPDGYVATTTGSTESWLAA